MCRFVLYLGTEITLDVLTTRPANSLIHQSFHSHLRKEPLNGDGFGIAWYVPEVSPEPAQFRSIQPAWNNSNLLHLARVSRSSVILAHVRAASAGTGVAEANCHPFVTDRLAFMHNGSVAQFAKLRRRIASRLSDESYAWVRGTTDSEYLFALFCDHFAPRQHEEGSEALAGAMEATIAEVVEIVTDTGAVGNSFLNLAVSDGVHAVVSRFATGGAESPSLYTLTGKEFVCEKGGCRMIPCDSSPTAVVVASEPLNDDAAWEPVPHNHLLLIRSDRSTCLRAID